MSIQERLKRGLVTIIIATIAIFAVGVPSAFANMRGTDVSGWQPADISRRIKTDFIVVQATSGRFYRNPHMDKQSSGALDTGKKLGLYHVANGFDAVTEADWFLSNAGEYVGSALLVLDWEAQPNSAWGDGNWVRTFVNRVHDRTGVWPLVYVQKSAIDHIPLDVWNNCGLWVSLYGPAYPDDGYRRSPWGMVLRDKVMLQYAHPGRFPGYSKDLNVDVFSGDESEWDAYANPNGAHKPSATPSTSGRCSRRP